MKHKIYKSRTVICTGCLGRETALHKSKKKAKEWILALGWVFVKDTTDVFCPKCKGDL